MGTFSSTKALPRSDALVQTGTFTTNDPTAHADATRPWDIVVTPLSRGQYNHFVAFLASPGLLLYREAVSTRVRVNGTLPPGIVALTVPLHCGAETRYWAAPLHERGLPITMPGGVHADFSAGQEHLILLVDIALFRQSVPEELSEAIERAACQHVVCASSDAICQLGRALNAVLESSRGHVAALDHPCAVQSMQQNVLAAFCRSLTLPLSRPRHPGPTMRRRGLEKAAEYLRSADAAFVTVGDLCAAASVSERTLEYAFREELGVSPRRFLHLQRYHTARRDLLAADCRGATVQTIAQSHGFYQLGRFAIGYKALFGESPSHTLMKPPASVHCGLPPVGAMGLSYRESTSVGGSQQAIPSAL